MAKPLNVNWQAIQQLFIQGNSGADIAKLPEYSGIKPATISARASRGKWMQLRHQTKEIVSNAATDVILNDLKAQAEKFVRDMGAEMMASLHLTKEIPKERNMKDLYARLAVLEKINRIGRETFELDKDGPQQIVNIGLFGMGDLLPEPSELPVTGQSV